MKQIDAEFAVKAFAWFCVACGGTAILMFLWWLLWLLWCFVLPQVYPTGPEGLIRPSYWLFAGMWSLFVLVVLVIKRRV